MSCSLLSSRTPSRTDTRDASEGVPSPTNPAASCTSNRPAGRAPTARSMMGRSLAPAWVIIVAGPWSTSARARTSQANGSTSATPVRHEIWTRQSFGQYVRSARNSVSRPYACSSSRIFTTAPRARSSSIHRASGVGASGVGIVAPARSVMGSPSVRNGRDRGRSAPGRMWTATPRGGRRPSGRTKSAAARRRQGRCRRCARQRRPG